MTNTPDRRSNLSDALRAVAREDADRGASMDVQARLLNEVRAIARARTELPLGSRSIAFYTADAIPQFRNNAFVASAQGFILRLRFADDNPIKVVDSEQLLENQVGPIQVLVAGPDGAVYFCTNTAAGRLSITR